LKTYAPVTQVKTATTDLDSMLDTLVAGGTTPGLTSMKASIASISTSMTSFKASMKPILDAASSTPP